MSIACCIICKDDSELPDLVKAVNSVYSYVDQVFITATGDETKQIEKYCSENDDLFYSYFKWTDSFSDARNFNFDQAQKQDDYDYILWIDADDLFIGGELLKTISTKAKEANVDTVFLTYWYGCRFEGEPSVKTFREVELEHMRERLIKPGVYTWKGRLHETPVPIRGYEPKYAKYPYDSKDRPIAVMHTSSNEGLVGKMMRNKVILEKQLDEERKRGTADPRTLLYLMKIYSEIGDKDLCDKSIKMGEEYLSKSGWEQERGVCKEQMGIAYGKMGNDLMANKCFHNAIKEHPFQVLFYIRLAQSYLNLKKYKECEHWMKLGAQLEIDNQGTDQTNLKAIKVSYAELLLNLNWNVKKDVKKALDAATLLYQENPTDNNKQNLLFIQDAYDLNEACRNVDKLSRYLHSIGEDKVIPKLLDDLPTAITHQPFAINIRKNFTPPKRWEENEICYFANFGGPFIEHWDAHNLEKGIGGSETAVIELSKEWSKLGFKVTVYGDPEKKGTDDFGINWLPWYYFNPKDSFNIFIQWRGWELGKSIKCNKFYVDLHDVVNNANLKDEDVLGIDKVFFKSKCHRALLTKLPQDKVMVVGNGIRI
jgi:glycosyltransferase involved in cell wall biosynthesis